MRNAQYSPKEISVRAGRLVFYLSNEEPTPCELLNCLHDIVITGSDSRAIAYSDKIQPGKAKVFTIESMPPGEYPFHDDIGMHYAELKMSGTLEVT